MDTDCGSINKKMIPISDDTGRRRRIPIIMPLLVAANIAVFLYEMTLSDRSLNRFIYSYAATPYEILNSVDVPPPGPEPIYLTLISSMFIHGSFLHIAGNMLFLWVFGDNVEDRLGHLRFLAFYFLTGLVASFTHILLNFDSQVPTIGASGAIAGVLGAYLYMFPGARVKVLLFIGPFFTLTYLSALIVIGYWALIQFLYGIGSLGVETAVAYWAHIGGFLAGLIIAMLFGRKPRSANSIM